MIGNMGFQFSRSFKRMFTVDRSFLHCCGVVLSFLDYLLVQCEDDTDDTDDNADDDADADADQHGIEIAKDKRGEQPFSIDENILHSSAEGKVLEDPWEEAPDYVYTRSVSPENAPDTPEEITIEFKKGDLFIVSWKSLS